MNNLCSKCKIEKDEIEFHSKNICKICKKEYKKEWREKNREHIREYSKDYQEKNIGS